MVLFKIFFLTLGLAWPFLIYFAIEHNFWEALALALVIIMLLRFLGQKIINKRFELNTLFLSLIALSLCALTYFFKRPQYLLWYPVAVNCFFFLIFSTSILIKKPIIEKLARLKTPNLDTKAIAYMRKVTLAWCGFFILNGSLAYTTVILNNLKLWTLWNGALSYVAMGLMFSIEYLIRLKVQGKTLTSLFKRKMQTKNFYAFNNLLDDNLEQIMFYFKDQAISKKQVKAEVIDLIAQIENLKLANRAHVALMTDSNYAFIKAFFACNHLKLKIILPGHKKPQLLNEQDPLIKLILSDDPQLLARNQKAFQVLTVNSTPNFNLQKQDINFTINLDDKDQFTLFTSGSTGKPKAVVKTIAIMQTEAKLLAEVTPWLNKSIFLTTVFPYHMYGLTFSVFLPLTFARPIYQPMIHYTEELCVNPYANLCLISSPAFIKRLDFKLKAPDLIATVCAGGPTALSYRQKFRQWSKITLFDIYGSTETGVIGFRHGEGENNEAPLTYLEGLKITGSDDLGFTLFSPLVPQGQFKLDDKLELIDDKHLRIIGRSDRIVKIEENRVSLDEVEKRLKEFDFIQDCAVVTLNYNERLSLGAVLVVDQSYLNLNAKEKLNLSRNIRQKLLQTLGSFAIPRHYCFVSSLPCNIMGKKDTLALKALFSRD